MFDFSTVLLSALGAGVAGGIAAILTQKIQNKNWKIAIQVALVVPAMQLTPKTPLKDVLDKHVFKKSRFEMASDKAGDVLLADAAVREKIKGLSQQELVKFFAQHAHDGMYWLELADLDRWNELRLRLAEQSKALCVSFVRGGAGIAELQKSIEKFSDAELADWMRISVAATKVAVSKGPKSLSTQDSTADFGSHLNEVISYSGPEDSKRLQASLKNYLLNEEDDVCWAAKSLHENAKKLPDEKRKKFLRGLASL